MLSSSGRGREEGGGRQIRRGHKTDAIVAIKKQQLRLTHLSSKVESCTIPVAAAAEQHSQCVVGFDCRRLAAEMDTGSVRWE